MKPWNIITKEKVINGFSFHFYFLVRKYEYIRPDQTRYPTRDPTRTDRRPIIQSQNNFVLISLRKVYQLAHITLQHIYGQDSIYCFRLAITSNLIGFLSNLSHWMVIGISMLAKAFQPEQFKPLSIAKLIQFDNNTYEFEHFVRGRRRRHIRDELHKFRVM